MASLTVNVHTSEKTAIKCEALVGHNTNTNMLIIDNVTIFASEDQLCRIVLAVKQRLGNIRLQAVALEQVPA